MRASTSCALLALGAHTLAAPLLQPLTPTQAVTGMIVKGGLQDPDTPQETKLQLVAAAKNVGLVAPPGEESPLLSLEKTKRDAGVDARSVVLPYLPDGWHHPCHPVKNPDGTRMPQDADMLEKWSVNGCDLSWWTPAIRPKVPADARPTPAPEAVDAGEELWDRIRKGNSAPVGQPGYKVPFFDGREGGSAAAADAARKGGKVKGLNATTGSTGI